MLVFLGNTKVITRSRWRFELNQELDVIYCFPAINEMEYENNKSYVTSLTQVNRSKFVKEDLKDDRDFEKKGELNRY